ncbi:hypothetical protein TrST_g10570 [Triparma strigata]|uniref:Fe2OG dioxygenase domain-containing protein n=1 Tax=Triparma strigata TaxID=1606541 RepID=A0A9W7EFX2_9STRA|nr:hypothetical protein TrST_g10570 [Triparma strigata]
MSKCLICLSEDLEIIDPVTFLPCLSAGCRDNVYCRDCLHQYVKNYASKCPGSCNRPVRITRSTIVYGDATEAMERNEAGRKEAMEAKALEEANMVMGVGELRKAYEQKIAQEDKVQESLALVEELSRQNSHTANPPEVTNEDLEELKRMQKEVDEEEERRRAAEIEASEKLIQSLSQEENVTAPSPSSDPVPTTSATASTTTPAPSTSSSSSPSPHPTLLQTPKLQPPAPTPTASPPPRNFNSINQTAPNSSFCFKASEIQSIVEGLTSETSAQVAASILQKLLSKRVVSADKKLAILPNGVTTLPKFLKKVKKKFDGDENFLRVYDRVVEKIQGDFNEENKQPKTMSKSQDKTYTVDSYLALSRSDRLPPNPLIIDDDAKNLRLRIYRPYEPPSISLSEIEQSIKDHMTWYRVKYESKRHKNDCETPCYTNYFGGVAKVSNNGEQLPYQEIPDYLKPLTQYISDLCGVQFNSFLVRLYFNGKDNIAHHTDGRRFLGDIPTIASLSLGATATFKLKRMNDVWPKAGTPDGGVDKNTPGLSFNCENGTLLIMEGDTQDHWHHAVPQESRDYRFNINFRYIVPTAADNNVDTEGQKTYYKYMVYGDHRKEWESKTLESWSFDDLMKLKGGMRNFMTKKDPEPAGLSATQKDPEPAGLSATQKDPEPAGLSVSTADKENKKGVPPEAGHSGQSMQPESQYTYQNSIFKSSARPAALKRPNNSASIEITMMKKPKLLQPKLSTSSKPSAAVKLLVDMGFPIEVCEKAVENHPDDVQSQINECVVNSCE